MGRKKIIKEKQLLEMIEGSRGFISVIAKRLNCNWHTVDEAIKASPAAQAVSIQYEPPRNPYLIEILAAAILDIPPGTKNGEINLEPFVSIFSCSASIILRPPIPVPTYTLALSLSKSLSIMPDISIASLAATKERATNRSILFISFLSMKK